MNLAYFEKGNPQSLPIILIHAFPLNRQMWRYQLEGLSDAYYVIAPDLPGFGESPILESSPNMAGYAQAIMEFMDQQSISQAVLGGCSMGGYILFEMYRQAPERFKGLILSDTRSENDPPEAREKRFNTIQEVEKNGTTNLAETMLPNLLSPTTFAKRESQANEIRETILANNPQGIIHALQAMADRPDSTETVSQLTVPTMVIVGVDDALTTPDVCRAMHDKIPNSEIKVIPEAGHLSPYENPDAVNKTIREFIQSQGIQ